MWPVSMCSEPLEFKEIEVKMLRASKPIQLANISLSIQQEVTSLLSGAGRKDDLLGKWTGEEGRA